MERAGFSENVRRVTAVDGWICVGDALLREIPCCICIIHSDRCLKSTNKVAAVGPRRRGLSGKTVCQMLGAVFRFFLSWKEIQNVEIVLQVC